MGLPTHTLWDAFEDGRRIQTESGVMEMRCSDVGSLVLPTGRMVACDPRCDLNQEPFSIRVPAGEYPVYLASTQLPGVALAMVRFQEDKPNVLRPANPRHFGVDSATASIMDASFARSLVRAGQNQFGRLWKQVDDGMEENGGLWSNVNLGARSGANIIAFRTLNGDGAFSSYLGYTSDKVLVCLVLDFFLSFSTCT